MANRILCALSSAGLASLFRAGQGMHQIIFSTLDHHRLASEPRVTLELHATEHQVRVAYGFGNLYFEKSTAEETVPESEALRVIIAYLARLWSETKSTPLPEPLRQP